ncbi:TetR family transcriptional regulator [Parafrankia colletiae]|uniref:TetR family transcriptional regulator n=1 Tax=Parafrankia colletiae TaxID=573497 RepID=A0A1S1QW69_9ACTN|nr:TetR/AcrR family transcriptional regulator [Parafrankia colletiae]MCK9904663.1 TetR/AcrR family transcriptional regulator [Frankia sp. Cpl3]OHV38953.1 TetR family transcriptional regulator [Parafrankia colletiae]
MEPGRTRNPPRQRATLVNTRSRETRLALTRAALDLWSAGDFNEAYEASTVGDIAQAAGVSKGTFYFHFANKEAILLEMSSATIQAMIDQVEAETVRNVPLTSLSEQVMGSMARRVVRAPRAAALRAGALGFTGQAPEGTVPSPRLSVAFETLLRYGRERGELGPRIDVEDVAAMLTAVTMEAIIRWGAGDRTAAWLSQTLRDRVAVILRGISCPDADQPSQG